MKLKEFLKLSKHRVNTETMKTLKIGELSIDVEMKDIKNVHLGVYPPEGRVKISAPLRMNLDTIRVYVITKLSWIRKQQDKIRNQIREAPREYLDRESHFYKGKRYLLKIIKEDHPPKIELEHSTINLYVRPEATAEKMENILYEWYRKEMKKLLPELISHWEKIMKVKVNEFGIKKMKTRWGTCNRNAGRIWLNLELIKKPPECLEYVLVHEMTHLLERKHNSKFVSLMDKFMPKWRFYKDELNRLPVNHEKWEY